MPPRVLYVEDHDDTRALVSLLLQKAGLHVTEATNGNEALELAGSRSFDLYLLDHSCPGLTGVALCRRIRESDAATPIIFYSGRAFESEREEAISAGAQEYLIKPDDLFRVPECALALIERGRLTPVTD